MRAAVLNFFDDLGGNALRFESNCRALGGNDLKADGIKFLRYLRDAYFILIAHANEHLAAARQAHATAQLGFGEGEAESNIDAHDFAGGLHFGTKQRVDARKFVERKNRFFDGNMLGQNFRGETQIL